MAGSIWASARRGLLMLGAILSALALVTPSVAVAAPRYAAIVVDARTGEVLYANAADERRYPASITKVMTLFLAFDALVAGRMRLSDPIVMTAHGASQRPSKLGLAPGRSISLEDAIRIITVKSANDVAVALAERIGGSERAFAQMMTRKARTLGMSNTTFTNASGLPDPGNMTTARDIATLAAALLKAHPSYYTYFGQQAFRYDNRSFTNHNRLLGKLAGLDGIKTGFTNDAGFTLAASAVRNGQRLITVVLGEPSIAARNRDVTALLDAGFSVLERRRAGEETSIAFNLPTLNHPALRLVNQSEAPLRSEPAVIRQPNPAPAIAIRPTPAKARVASKATASAKATKSARSTAKAGATRSAKRATPAATRSAARSDKGGKSVTGKAATKTAAVDKATTGKAKAGKAKASEKTASAAKARPVAKSPADKSKAGATRTAANDAAKPERSAIDDWNAKFKSPRSARP